MDKAYIILAHKNEDQLLRLVERLDDGKSSFFIHIDKKSPLQQKKALFNQWANVVFVPNITTEWGNLSLVDATLNAMHAVRDSGRPYERVILLSGQDYPIKTTDEINRFFETSEYSIFMDHIVLPDYKKWSNGGAYRFNKYFFGFSVMRKYMARTMNFLSTYIKPLQRKLRPAMEHFYGSQWWIIDAYTLDHILDFVNNNAGYMMFHQHTFAPDELFFQTIVMNSSDERIFSRLLNNNLKYMKWQESSSAHPEVLTVADYDELVNSPALFARKFDDQVDEEILDMLDERIHSIITEKAV